MFADQNPYRPPTPGFDTGIAESGKELPGRVHELGWAIIAALGVRVVVDGFRLMVLLDLHQVYSDLAAKREGARSSFDLEIARDYADILAIMVALVAAILWWTWAFRVAKNVRSFGAESLGFSPTSIVGWWFVPVFNFIRPYQGIVEVWRASVAAAEGRVHEWPDVPIPGILRLWWVMLVAGAFGLPLMYEQSGRTPTDAIVGVLACGTQILAALATAAMVVVLGRLQDRAWARCS